MQLFHSIRNIFYITVVVTPPAPQEIKYKRQTIGCNLIEWTPIDTGNCHVKYTIRYENQTGVIGTITNIDGSINVWCTNMYSDATAVKIWAVYNGNRGEKSATITLTDNVSNTGNPSGESIVFITLVIEALQSFSKIKRD